MKQEGQRHLSATAFLVFIIVLGFFPPLSTDMYLPAIPDMVDEFGTSDAIMNMTLYGFMLSMAVSILLIGPLADKYGRKRILLASLVEYIVTTLLCSVVTEVWQLILLRVLQAVGAGSAIVMSTAFVKDCYTGRKRVMVLNLIAVAGVLGPLIAPVMGAFIITQWGWRPTFYVDALLGIAAILFTLVMDETLKEEDRVEGGIRQMLGGMHRLVKSRAFTEFCFMSCLFNLPFMGYLSVSSYIYEDMFGLSETVYSLLLAVTLIIGTAGMVIINRLTRNVVNRRMVPVYAVLGFVSAFFVLSVGDRSWLCFMLPFALCVVIGTTVRPWGTAILMASHDGDNGAVSSFLNFVFFLIGCIGMVMSTLPWKDYAFGIGMLILFASIAYTVLMFALKGGKEHLKYFDYTPSGKGPK